MNKQVNKGNRYSGIPDFRILIFWNLLITRTQKSFPVLSRSAVNLPSTSHSPIFPINFRFPWRLEKSGIHCTFKSLYSSVVI